MTVKKKKMEVTSMSKDQQETSPANSNKRKSYAGLDYVQDENKTPNIIDHRQSICKEQASAKKFRSKEISNPKITDSSFTLRSRSGLPRYNQCKAKTGLIDKRRQATEINSAERRTSLTNSLNFFLSQTPNGKASPMREKLVGSSAAIIKRLKKYVGKTPSVEVIKEYFDGAFTFTEDKMNGIMSNLKIKSKWDYKEKSKKQDVVIKELRDSLINYISEIKSLRENCLIHENYANCLVKDVLDEFQDNYQALTLLQQNEKKTKKQFVKVQDDLQNANTLLSKLRNEHTPLVKKAKEFEELCNQKTAKLLEVEEKKKTIEAKLDKTIKEFEDFKKKTENDKKSLKETYDKVNFNLLYSNFPH
jgi:hypothetical protein